MLSTETKIAFARAATSLLFSLGIKPHRIVSRGEITFALDLNEGIDLSIFLLGHFQKRILKIIERFVPVGGTVIDIGANVGAIALPVAALKKGRVIAIEPTDYAFAKLQRNVLLNPDLMDQITIVKTFVADQTRPTSDLIAYSSWRLNGARLAKTHPIHLGTPMTASCGQITIDDLVVRQRLTKISLIKIDTDGHEFAVLRGASSCLSTLRPIVVFEACTYLMSPPNPTFDQFERLFRRNSYTICDPKSMRPMLAHTFEQQCPTGGGLDLLAVPDEHLDFAGGSHCTAGVG